MKQRLVLLLVVLALTAVPLLAQAAPPDRPATDPRTGPWPARVVDWIVDQASALRAITGRSETLEPGETPEFGETLDPGTELGPMNDPHGAKLQGSDPPRTEGGPATG